MSDKKTMDAALIAKYQSDAVLVAKYKAEAVLRRKLGNSPTEGKARQSVQAKDGVFTVRFSPDAKPVSALGGIAKVLGRSRIAIPEFKLRRG